MGLFKKFMNFLGKRGRSPVNKWMVNKVIGERNRKGIGRFLTGKKPEQRIVERYTDQQKGVLEQLLSQGMQETDSGGLEERYKKLFEEQLIPGIAQQFTTSGGQRSSGFKSALGRAGSDLASQLSAMRSGRGMQKLGMGLQPQFDVENVPGEPGFIQQTAAPAIMAALLAGTGGMAAGGMGGMGGMMGGALGGLLGGKGGQQQQQGQAQGYMPGQPQGFSSESVNPAMLKMLMGMLL